MAAPVPEEHRRYGAEQAHAIWHGDVLHGPTMTVNGRRRKVYLVSVYLVSLMDDASRLIAHSAFCTGEAALDIEGVLKQAVLKRGLPRKLVVDNGAAYRAATLQGICARLDIRLIYCRPYAPEGKGKLERYQQDRPKIHLRGMKAARLDALFQHRVARKVRKDGTLPCPTRARTSKCPTNWPEKPSNWWSIRRRKR